jgi:hypothetical protein
MNPSPENHEQKLERLIGKTLRDLPPRRAPVALEDRVLAELERRAALPWWRKSYAHWPLAARAAFLVASIGIIRVVILAIAWAQAGFESAALTSAFAPLVNRISSCVDLADSIAEFSRAVLQSISPVWLYGGLGALALMYLTLFGVGAFAYRTLYSRR